MMCLWDVCVIDSHHREMSRRSLFGCSDLSSEASQFEHVYLATYVLRVHRYRLPRQSHHKRKIFVLEFEGYEKDAQFDFQRWMYSLNWS